MLKLRDELFRRHIAIVPRSFRHKAQHGAVCSIADIYRRRDAIHLRLRAADGAALTGSADLVGLSVGLVGISRFLVAYPVGRITDALGRKPGILMGLGLALVGATVVGVAMGLHSFGGFVVGILIFGMGMNASQQFRVAATDMFPPQHRAQAWLSCLGFAARARRQPGGDHRRAERRGAISQIRSASRGICCPALSFRA